MAKEYLDKLKNLMVEIAPDISTPASLEVKHFFSGAALMRVRGVESGP